MHNRDSVLYVFSKVLWSWILSTMSFFDCLLFPLFILPTIRVNLKVILLREKGFSRSERKKGSLAENETRLNYLIFLHHFVLIFTVSANLILWWLFFIFFVHRERQDHR